MACPTCNGRGTINNPEVCYRAGAPWVTGRPPQVPCPNPDCPDKPMTAAAPELHGRVAKGVKVVNIAPNQDWSGVPVIFNGDNQ